MGQDPREADILRATSRQVTPGGSFKHDTLLYGMAVIADRAVGFVLLPFLTSGLSKADFGAWNQIQTIYGFLSTALLMGFYHTVSSLVAGRGSVESRIIYAGILRLVLLSSTILLVACVAFPEPISAILFAEKRYSSVVLVMALFAVSECFYEIVVMAFLRAQSEISYCAAFHSAKSVARLAIVWIGLQAQEPLITILAVSGLTNAAIILYVLLRRILPGNVDVRRHEMPKGYWWGAIRRSLAIAITVLIAWASMASNRFFIVHLLGLDRLAVYSANYSIFSVTTFVPMILTFTLLHHLSRAMQAGDVESSRQLVDKSIAIYLFITLPLLLLIALFYQDMVEWLAPGYGVGWVLRASLMAYFFMFGLEQILVFATFSGTGGYALAARLLALGINLVVGYLFIFHGGVQYAAVSLCLGSTLIVVMCWVTLRRRIGGSHSWTIYRYIAISTMGAALIGWMLTTFWSPVGAVQAIMVCIALLLLFIGIESSHRHSLTRELTRDLIGQVDILRSRYGRSACRRP